MKSWDGFQIPPPFTRCEIILMEPMVVPRAAEESRREELRLELEGNLRAGSAD